MTDEITDENVKSAIISAAKSLARCEQCRASLERKLVKKGFENQVISQALDYLESKNYLDDYRYASFWIRSHCDYKPQGSYRLLKDLCERGLSRETASAAIKEYFESHNEEELCSRAFDDLIKKNKSEEKILNSLANSGFSYKIIQRVFKNKKGQSNAS